MQTAGTMNRSTCSGEHVKLAKRTLARHWQITDELPSEWKRAWFFVMLRHKIGIFIVVVALDVRGELMSIFIVVFVCGVFNVEVGIWVMRILGRTHGDDKKKSKVWGFGRCAKTQHYHRGWPRTVVHIKRVLSFLPFFFPFSNPSHTSTPFGKTTCLNGWFTHAPAWI